MTKPKLVRARRWLSETSNLVHLSVLVFVPLLMFALVEISRISEVSYLLFPPLASATFTVFSDPEGKYSNTRRIVGGLTLGALIGWLSFEVFGFGGVSSGVALVLTGGVTWFTDTEHPSAFSASLLAVFLELQSPLYVISVFWSSLFVGVVLSVWEKRFYEVRSQYLYESTWSDDRVLLPIRNEVDKKVMDEKAEAGITDFASRVASAHKGRIVLLEITEDESVIQNAKRLEEISEVLEERYEIDVEVAILETDKDESNAVIEAAEKYSCDIIIVPWEETEDESGAHLSDYIRNLFKDQRDVVVFKGDSMGPWRETFVPIRSTGPLSRLMVDLAARVVNGGTVSVSTIISRESQRRRTERELFDLVDGFSGKFETRVSNAGDIPLEEFIARASREYDMMFIGASTDRSAPSQFVSSPMFEKVLHRVDIPVAIVHSASSGKERLVRVPDWVKDELKELVT